MPTTKAAEVKVQALLDGCSSFKAKQGDGHMYGLTWRLKAADSKADDFRWLYLGEKSGRQCKLAISGDPEGVIGTLSSVRSTKGDISFNFVTSNPEDSQIAYLWARQVGADEVSISAAQGALEDVTE